MAGNDRIAVGHLSYRRNSSTHYLLVEKLLRKPATGVLRTLCGKTSKYGDDGWWDAGDPINNPATCSACAKLVVITKEAF